MTGNRMLLGINSVIEARAMVVGRFYLIEDYDGNALIVQCVQTRNKIDDEPELVAIRYAPDTGFPLGIQSLPQYGPVVELGEVHVRVDAPSTNGTSLTSYIRAGSFVVVESEAFIAVPRNDRGWMLVNIMTGLEQAEVANSPWVSFTRWLLVIDDNGEEIPIASFGEEAH